MVSSASSQAPGSPPLDGRVAVVTGGASGMGVAVARIFLRAGARVVAADRNAAGLAAAFEGEKDVVSVAGDITADGVAANLLDTALRHFGRCDIVFNNAGTCEVGPLATIDIERVCAMVRVNVEAAFRVAYTFTRHFAKVGAGHLVSTSSVLGTKVRPTAGAYAGTKHAIEALSEGLRLELAHTAVKISCIEPGLVATPLHDGWAVHPREVLNISEPLNAEDIAKFVLWIVTQPDRLFIPRLMILPNDQEI